MRERGDRERSDSREVKGRKPSSLRAVYDALRSVPERLRRPEALLMLLAMFASVGVHMPPYLGLGVLADYFDEKERAREEEAPPPITFEVTTDEKPTVPTPPPEEVAAAEEPEPEKKRREREKTPPRKPREEVAEPEKPEPEPEPEKLAVVEPPPEPPPPPPPQQQRKQSITQKSEDPDVEPPPDAQYLAEENRRVEEETVASVTSETKDDPNPNAAAPQAEGPEESGDSLDDERGAMRGSESARDERSASRERVREQATPRPAPDEQPASREPARAERAGADQAPRVAAPEEVVVRDPMGSFVLAPSAPQAARSSSGGRSGSSGRKKPNIKVSWSAFEQTFGAEQLAQDRMPREAKRRGAGREKRWDEFRAAIENYVVGVKSGNATALNAAADPFAAYIAAFHRNLHMEFAHEFLASLPMAGGLADPQLVTKVEIVVNADGSLDRVGVVNSSGNLMYDFGAFNAVQRGAPYPPPPAKIRSPDGRVYMRWALHRNESQCGTWNAEPYILKSPPRSPNDPKRDNVSPYRQGSDTEQGKAPAEEPRRSPGDGAAVAPGETLGRLERPWDAHPFYG